MTLIKTEMNRSHSKQQKGERVTTGRRFGWIGEKYVRRVGLTRLALLISRQDPEEDLLPPGEAVQVEAELDLGRRRERIQGTVTAGEVRGRDSRYGRGDSQVGEERLVLRIEDDELVDSSRVQVGSRRSEAQTEMILSEVSD